jgi:hypothetical protein
MKKVAVFIKKYSIGKSSPLLCLLDFLSDNCKVDLFIQDVYETSTAILKKNNINLVELKKKVGSKFIQKMKHVIAFSRNDIQRVRNAFKAYDYSNYICIDPHGFFLCKQLFPEARPYYYSLELYFRNDHFNLDYPKDVMNTERAEIGKIKGLIIQSREKELLFREEYNLPDNIPALLLPVTYLKPSVKDKSAMLRNKYGISVKNRIALHLGGIQEYFSCIELALTFAMLHNWVLIFHGYHFGGYIKVLKKTLKKHNINNVFISEEVYEQIEDMDPLLMSCDLGIAWYNNVSLNFSTAGKSSGKIAAYLRFGLPVIAKKYRSTVEAIEETGCGVCVDNFPQIEGALKIIENNYATYSVNCRKEYDKVYWFANYKNDILKFLGEQ